LSDLAPRTKRVVERDLRRFKEEVDSKRQILQARVSQLELQLKTLIPEKKKRVSKRKRNLNAEFKDSKTIIQKKRMSDAGAALAQAEAAIRDVISSNNKQKKEKITLKLKM
jgi:hypothetical protein